MELAVVIAAMIIMLMVFSVFCLATFFVLIKLQSEKITEKVVAKGTPNKFEIDDSVPIDQFTPDFSRPINFQVKGYETN